MNSSVGPLFIMMASTLWAIDALIRTPLTKDMPPAAIVFYEHLFGLIILSPIFVKSIPILATLSIKTWGYITLLALVSSIGGTMLFTQALGASFATGDFITPLLLLKLQPILVIILSVILLNENISRTFYPFAALAFIGSYTMSFGATLPSFHFSGKELVVLLSFGASLCWSLGTIISKTLLKRFSTREATFLRFLAAVPVGFAVMALSDQTYSPMALTTSHLLRFTVIALSTGAVALLIYYFGLSKTKAHIATIAELIFPLTSIIIGITSLNPYGAAQTLTAPQIVGIIMLLIAVMRISSLNVVKEEITIEGIVQKGAGDGKKFGFPTANLALVKALDMPYGVYAGRATVERKAYNCVLHYGPRLIFKEEKPLFEVHILDFKKSIYGKKMRVDIKHFIRKTQYFSSSDEMITQIHQDCLNARRLLPP